MDWAAFLLEGHEAPLALKEISSEKPPNRHAQAFLTGHPDLAISAQALAQGPPGRFVPNMADTGNRQSVYLSFFFFDSLLQRLPDITIGQTTSGQNFGNLLEMGIARGLRTLVGEHHLDFTVSAKGDQGDDRAPSFRITDYWPYATPPTRPSDPGEAQVYRALGRGHLIQPDVVIWRNRKMEFMRVENGETVPITVSTPQLFACISGKATIRSDRSQSSRYEGNALMRWRRARPPHIMVVTAEPSPSRLGSLAWGLGDLDCVYHVNLAALYHAFRQVEEEIGRRTVARDVGSSEELKDLIEHARVKDISQLFDDLFSEFLKQSP